MCNLSYITLKTIAREDSYSMKPNLMHILERMNKVYTKNGDRINESTDWVHYFHQLSNNLKTKQDLRNYPASYWEDIRQRSYKYYNEDNYKKRAYSIYSDEKNFNGEKEKNPFLVYDDEKKTGFNSSQDCQCKILCFSRYR